MRVPCSCQKKVAFALAAAGMILLNGCGQSREAVEGVPRNPKQAASQLQRVFETASPEVKRDATVASEALRQGDYPKAIVTLQVLRSGQGQKLTFEQGLAIHNSAVAMEAKLVSAMDAGDENARRAYQLLKDLKRK